MSLNINQPKGDQREVSTITQDDTNCAPIAKTLSSLIAEQKEYKKEIELLSQQVKNLQSNYSKNLKQYNLHTKSVMQFEKSKDEIDNKILSLQKKKKLIISSITNEFFSYVKPMSTRTDLEILKGICLFFNFPGPLGEQIEFILNTKDNLITLLLNSEKFLKIIHEENYILFSERKKIIQSIKEKFQQKLIFPFDVIYDFIMNSFEEIKCMNEGDIFRKKIEETVKQKDFSFLSLKEIENKIRQKDVSLQNLNQYLSNLNSVLEKYKALNGSTVVDSPLSKNSVAPGIEEISTSIIELKKTEPSTTAKKPKETTTKKNQVLTSDSSTFFTTKKFETFSKTAKTISALSLSSHVFTHKSITSLNNTSEKAIKKITKNNRKSLQVHTANTINTISDRGAETKERTKPQSKKIISRLSNGNLSFNKSNTQIKPRNTKLTKAKANKSINDFRKVNTKGSSSSNRGLVSLKSSFTSFKKKCNKVLNNNSPPKAKKMKNIPLKIETKLDLTSNNNEEKLMKSTSKDSMTFYELNSVCDELTVEPINFIPGKLNKDYSINNNYLYYNNPQKPTPIRKRGLDSNTISFKVDKPVPMGGCCVSCT